MKHVEGILALLLVRWVCVCGLDRWGGSPLFVCTSEFTHRGVASCVPLLDPEWSYVTTLRQTSILPQVPVCLKKFQERRKYSWVKSFFRLSRSFMGVWFLSSSDGLAPACLPYRNVSCRSPYYWQPQILIHRLCFVDRIFKFLGALCNSIIVVRSTVEPRSEFRPQFQVNLMCGWPCIVIQCG